MIKIITCHHHRHDCARLFYLGVDRMRTETDEKIQVYAAITKDDDESIEIARANGAKIIVTDNKPLGKKWNAAYRIAYNKVDIFRHHKIIILGEDNLMGIYPYMNHWNVQGFDSCAIIDTKTGKASNWKYFDDLQLIGAGRIFPQPEPFKVAKTVRPIKIGDYTLEMNTPVPVTHLAEEGRTFIKPREIIALWDDNLNSGLDRSSEQNLALLGREGLQIKTDRPYVIDFKTDMNIHPINEFGGCEPIEFDWKWFLSDKEKEYINKTWGI